MFTGLKRFQRIGFWLLDELWRPEKLKYSKNAVFYKRNCLNSCTTNTWRTLSKRHCSGQTIRTVKWKGRFRKRKGFLYYFVFTESRFESRNKSQLNETVTKLLKPPHLPFQILTRFFSCNWIFQLHMSNWPTKTKGKRFTRWSVISGGAWRKSTARRSRSFRAKPTG